MQQLFPRQADVDDPAAIYDRIELPAAPAGRAYLYANMVSSADGRAQFEGRAAGLGSPVDQELMQRLRARADCVLNGAGTVNADQVRWALRRDLVEGRRLRGQADQPLWAVATGSGDVRSDANLFRPGDRPAIAFVADQTPAERRQWLEERADVVIAGDSQPDPTGILEILHQRYGCRLVLSEGGPTFNHAMLAAGVLDELFLTFAPKLVAGEGKTIVHGQLFARERWPRLQLVTLYEHQDELFFRYRVKREASA